MNWTQFLSGLAAIYLFYYVLNMLFDIFKSGKHPISEGGVPELVFGEPNQVVTVSAPEPVVAQEPATRQVISSGQLESTGAVSIKQMFALAQVDAIRFTGAIPY